MQQVIKKAGTGLGKTHHIAHRSMKVPIGYGRSLFTDKFQTIVIGSLNINTVKSQLHIRIEILRSSIEYRKYVQSLQSIAWPGIIF